MSEPGFDERVQALTADLPLAPPPQPRPAPAGRQSALAASVSARDALAEWIREEQRGEESVLSFGWPTIDRGLGKPIRPGEVILVGARTGIGKSFIAQHLVERCVSERADSTALSFTLEMSAFQMAERHAAHALGVSPREAARLAWQGRVTPEEVVGLMPGLDRVRFYEPSIAVDRVEEAMIEAAARLGQGLSLVVVDYAGLLAWEGASRASIYERASENARRLKDVAKRTRAVVVVCAQLSRAGGGSGDREPELDAFRDSGAAEEAADRALLAWRDPPEKGEARRLGDGAEVRCKIAKNRYGGTGYRTLLRYDHALRLSEVDEYVVDPGERLGERDLPEFPF